jgi:membrane-bound lytic murein transglycosylase A
MQQMAIHKTLALITVFFLTLTTLSGCARVRVQPTDSASAFREITPPNTIYDDQNLANLSEAIKEEIPVLDRTGERIMTIGDIKIPRKDYAVAMRALIDILDSARSVDGKLKYIKENFRFYEIFGKEDWGEVFITSYFEPIIDGSRSSSATRSRALLAKPHDLITVNLAKFSKSFENSPVLKGRLVKDQLVPYYTRKEIDTEGVLDGKSLELAWVDPVDAFFLQIQGSGTIRYSDGSEEHLVYADKNGHRYEAIGRFLRDRIAPKPVTMGAIKELLKSASSSERDEILNMNPSYVFFRRSKERAITALGVQATPGRTVAVDPRYAPKGALALLEYQRPEYGLEGVEFKSGMRFVVDQDSGGAITGPARVDLFWGRGSDAEKHAGVVQHWGRLVYLVPR